MSRSDLSTLQYRYCIADVSCVARIVAGSSEIVEITSGGFTSTSTFINAATALVTGGSGSSRITR